MIQYTTPTIACRINGVTLGNTDDVRVSIQPKGGGQTLTITDPDVEQDGEDSIVSCVLTQQQSASLPLGSAFVQVNWVTAGGVRVATRLAAVTVDRNLIDEVIVHA